MLRKQFIVVLAILVSGQLPAAEPVKNNAPVTSKVSLPKYRVEIFDVLEIRAKTPRAQSIDGYYVVEADGTIDVGPKYGNVRVGGMTIEEITGALKKHLRVAIAETGDSVKLAKVSRKMGRYVVGPDGTVTERQYDGVATIAGKFMAEAKTVVVARVEAGFSVLKALVEVAGNSKDSFLIIQGAGGDFVQHLSIAKDETVADAMKEFAAWPNIGSVWIERPTPPPLGRITTLTVDWKAISHGAPSVTNYHLLPGDRLYIQTYQTMSRGYNRNRNGI